MTACVRAKKQQSGRGDSSQGELTAVRANWLQSGGGDSIYCKGAIRAKCQQSHRADRRHVGGSSQFEVTSVKERLQPLGEVLLASES